METNYDSFLAGNGSVLLVQTYKDRELAAFSVLLPE
jgi:hypothetical protein